MRKMVEYTTETDRSDIIAENASMILVEEQNLIDGNFLVFADSLSDLFPEPTPLEKRITQLETDNLILMEVLATMYEDMLAKGTV